MGVTAMPAMLSIERDGGKGAENRGGGLGAGGGERCSQRAIEQVVEFG
jgi:hypothetical protein